MIESYGLRGSMESRFNQLQLAGGMKEALATDQADVTSLGSDYDDWLWLSSIIEEFEK